MGWFLLVALNTTESAASPSQTASRCPRAVTCGSIEGVVTGLPSGLGIADVSVTLRSVGDPWLEVRTTDLDGSFRFSELPSGLYSLEAKGLGWRSASVAPVVVVPGVPITEHLELRQLPPPIRVPFAVPPDPGPSSEPRS
jgi:hypothetical protein